MSSLWPQWRLITTAFLDLNVQLKLIKYLHVCKTALMHVICKVTSNWSCSALTAWLCLFGLIFLLTDCRDQITCTGETDWRLMEEWKQLACFPHSQSGRDDGRLKGWREEAHGGSHPHTESAPDPPRTSLRTSLRTSFLLRSAARISVLFRPRLVFHSFWGTSFNPEPSKIRLM